MASTFYFNGVTISAGVSSVRGSTGVGYGHKSGSFGSGHFLSVSGQASGISIDPFHYRIDCPGNCQLQSGDSITVQVSTLLLVDKTRISWRLCGGECTGSETEWGLAFGFSVGSSTWRVP